MYFLTYICWNEYVHTSDQNAYFTNVSSHNVLFKLLTMPITLMYYLCYRKWQDYVYIQCEYKSTKQKIKHLLREENKVKENKIS